MIDLFVSPDIKWQQFVDSLTDEEKRIAACWLPKRLNGVVNVDSQIKMVKSYLERKTDGNSS